jgi:hypothetical protein
MNMTSKFKYCTIFLLALFALPLAAQEKVDKPSKEERKQELINDLGLNADQVKKMEALKEEHFLESNRLREKMKAEHEALRNSYDTKLKSILTEKQYYEFKAKARKGMAKRGKHGAKGRKGLRHMERGEMNKGGESAPMPSDK